MKYTNLTTIAAAVTMLAAVQLTSAQETEKSVAFLTADKKYITTAPSGALDLSGTKVGSKQIFTLIDVNGGELADGDSVKIRYTPNSPTGPDASKANFWRETKEGLKRGHEAEVFKVKKVDTKYAFVTPASKFVAAPATPGPLTLSDKQEGALLVEIVEAPAVVVAPKKAAQPEAAQPEAVKPDPAKPEM